MPQNKVNQLYKILSFQYKPLEKRIKAIVIQTPDGVKAWQQYEKLPTSKKIAVLDRMAAYYRL